MAITSNPTIQNGAVSVGNGTHSFLNITSTTAVKSTQGRICTVNVTVADGAVSIYDSATTGAIAAGNKVAVLADALGSYSVDFPCANGIVVVPNGSTVSVSFN